MDLRQNHPWDTHKITRLSIPFSTATPVFYQTHLYKKKGNILFDMHYGLELGIVLKGKMRRLYKDARIDLGPGEPWLCGMWEPHGFELLNVPCKVLVITICPPMLATLRFDEAPDFNWMGVFMLPHEKRTKLKKTLREHLIEAGRKFEKLCAAQDGIPMLRVRVMLLDILLLLGEAWKVPAHAKQSLPHVLEKLDRVLRMVFDSKHVITVPQAARECGMNKNAFSTFFKELMGISFPDFALRYRLQNVASLLMRTETPVKALATEWGFTDTSHLSRCFAKHYGCTPVRYRKLTEDISTRQADDSGGYLSDSRHSTI